MKPNLFAISASSQYHREYHMPETTALYRESEPDTEQTRTNDRVPLLHVWVDADSCPREVRRVLLHAAARLNGEHPPALLQRSRLRPEQGSQNFCLPFHFVAAPVSAGTGNAGRYRFICPDPTRQLYLHEVPAGPDACDHFIEQHCQDGDIVITRDIVFAEKLCQTYQKENGPAGLRVINDRGTEYTEANVSARRRQRDLALELRSSDLRPDHSNRSEAGKAGYSPQDLKQFAACFDRCLSRQIQYCKQMPHKNRFEQEGVWPKNHVLSTSG
ncbi:DUF188 domain-containing protein [Candidatus Haliotispira prima]|uniref:DUF188 domain-containing protein n=1 Tax=Candidatus Haliotispira prima TaxID=3034016 RepID=A0ABY8MFB2_9SPIO|nr:DUF188 domain-containing protein [Candidatus Haliotispira prima]